MPAALAITRYPALGQERDGKRGVEPWGARFQSENTMKKILIVLAGALIATAAVAQSTSPPGGGRDPYDRRDSDGRRSFHERDGRGFHDRDGRGPAWHDEMMMRHHGWGGGGRRGMHEEMRGGGMGGRSGGAHFRLQRGDARIDIRCGDNEPIGVCVEAAGRLIDKVMTLRATGTDGPATRPGGTPDTPRPQ